MKKFDLSFLMRKILEPSVFLVIFVIQYIALFGWSVIIYGILESIFLEYSPSGNTAIFLFGVLNLLLAGLISGVSILIYFRTKKIILFWIIYTIFNIFLFLISSYIFRDLVI